MNLKLRLGVLAGLLMGANFANADGEIYLSAGAGTFDHDRTNIMIRTAAGTTTWLNSPSAETDLVSVAWGVADETARFLVEYYHQTGDIDAFPAEYKKQSLFYSGYWTPNLYLQGLHGILGAGIGGAQLSLESGNSLIGEDFEDREAQYKLTAGIEYRLMDIVTFYGTYERHYTRTYSHWTEARQIDVQDAEQSLVQFGVAARF